MFTNDTKTNKGANQLSTMTKHFAKHTTHLKAEVYKQTDNESSIQALKASDTESTWHRLSIIISRSSGFGPQLTSVLALPGNLVFPEYKKNPRS